MIRLIAFLGNKGLPYARTRHNSGWMFLDTLLGTLETPSWHIKFHGEYSQTTIAGKRMILLKPQTYMNESGRSIGELSRFFTIQPEEILVVHDDIELPFGTVRLQSGGGFGGHNGLRSAAREIESDRFARLRIGIGRPSTMAVATYVLRRFTAQEEAELPLVLDAAAELIVSWLETGCAAAYLPRSFAPGDMILP